MTFLSIVISEIETIITSSLRLINLEETRENKRNNYILNLIQTKHFYSIKLRFSKITIFSKSAFFRNNVIFTKNATYDTK